MNHGFARPARLGAALAAILISLSTMACSDENFSGAKTGKTSDYSDYSGKAPLSVPSAAWQTSPETSPSVASSASDPSGTVSKPLTEVPTSWTTASVPSTTAPTEAVPDQAPVPLPDDPQDDDFVRVADYIPDLTVDLKYATAENFTGQTIYDFSDAYLRYGTVKKLAAAADILRAQGYCLKIWDGYRPPAAQWKLWAICPDGRYVSDPNKGYSGHCQGNTVDLTLCLADGTEPDMPTGFDDFTAKADRDYSDCTDIQRTHAQILESVLIAAGFKPYAAEWWHYTDTDSYPVYGD